MTIAVDLGRKATNKTKTKQNITNKDRYQSTSARRALALLNSPLNCHVYDSLVVWSYSCIYSVEATKDQDKTSILEAVCSGFIHVLFASMR